MFGAMQSVEKVTDVVSLPQEFFQLKIEITLDTAYPSVLAGDRIFNLIRQFKRRHC